MCHICFLAFARISCRKCPACIIISYVKCWIVSRLLSTKRAKSFHENIKVELFMPDCIHNVVLTRHLKMFNIKQIFHGICFKCNGSSALLYDGWEQLGLIYSLLWCDTWSLKWFHSTKIVIVWKLRCKYSKSQYVPTDPLHHFLRITAAPRSSRGRWATRNSRENKRSVFPQERSAEKLANHSPASLKGSWTWRGRGLLGSETWEELGFLSSER